MNDNENKTNAPIKLPVRYNPDNWEILDADNCAVCVVNVEMEVPDTMLHEYGEHIAAALNEADALRAEVEGYRTAMQSILEASAPDYCHIPSMKGSMDFIWQTASTSLKAVKV